MTKLGLDPNQVSQSTKNLVDSEMLPFWRRVTVHYALRLLVAPLIESCILLDRLLYLRENGITNSWISSIFDPELSPRNFAIVARKT